MAFSAILRKSASSLVPTASQLARYSAVFSASNHLNRKPTLDSFVPVFDFSSATETKKSSSKYESLLQSIDSKIKLLDDHDSVEEPPSEFTLKIERTHIYTHMDDQTIKYHIVLTREYQGELVEVSSHIYDHTIAKNGTSLDLDVTINNHGGSSLKFDCRGTSDVISIWEMGIINSENSKNSTESSIDEQFQIDDLDENLEDLTEFPGYEQFQNKVFCNDIDENLKKAFLKYLEIRGIKPSIVDFLIKLLIKRVSNKITKRKLMGLKKIKNFIEQLS